MDARTVAFIFLVWADKVFTAYQMDQYQAALTARHQEEDRRLQAGVEAMTGEDFSAKPRKVARRTGGCQCAVVSVSYRRRRWPGLSRSQYLATEASSSLEHLP
mmetsp:Transcript_118123/g.378536  ORF Transcript_118123/g.378536 Transcript_118123/m.378536 type:complete len:103 (+) Transcript_118123:2-310(+)